MVAIQTLVPKDKISAFCKQWNVVELALFGSVLRADFRPESDVDVLVTFSKDAKISLFDLVRMERDLEEIFNRTVDIVEKDALENPYRRKEILNTAQVIYEA